MHASLALNPPASFRILRMSVFAPLVLLAAALGGAQVLAEQAPATTAPHTTARKASHPHKKAVAAHAKHPAARTAQTAQAASAPQAAEAPAKPAAPEMPLWPANEKATQATVTWDSHGLRIEAANSSLRQILRDVAAATGARVSGLDTDERVFGAYGPGPVHDVLFLLLQGSGYNILMTGDQGQGTPREILLTSHHAGGSAPAAAASDDDSDDDDDAEEQPEPPPSQRPGLGAQRRNPQQMQQEMERRQQQMRENQQQGQPPSNPPD
jgi:hypothetical protein